MLLCLYPGFLSVLYHYITVVRNFIQENEHVNIMLRDVQRKNVVNNVYKSSLRAQWQNGSYKFKHTEQHKTHRTPRRNIHSEYTIFVFFEVFYFYFTYQFLNIFLQDKPHTFIHFPVNMPKGSWVICANPFLLCPLLQSMTIDTETPTFFWFARNVLISDDC